MWPGVCLHQKLLRRTKRPIKFLMAMDFKEFRKKIYSSVLKRDVVAVEVYVGHTIAESASGVFVDNKPTSFGSIDEAKKSLQLQRRQDRLFKEMWVGQYAKAGTHWVAGIIKKHHHDARLTDSLIEKYTNIAAAKEFTPDPAVVEMRVSGDVGQPFCGKVDFTLEDGSKVMVSEELLNTINNVLGRSEAVIDYMKSSQHNFMYVVKQLEG